MTRKCLMFVHNNRITQVGPIIVPSTTTPGARRRINNVAELIEQDMKEWSDLAQFLALRKIGNDLWLVENRGSKQGGDDKVIGFYQIVECGDPL